MDSSINLEPSKYSMFSIEFYVTAIISNNPSISFWKYLIAKNEDSDISKEFSVGEEMKNKVSKSKSKKLLNE
jgi:hypothetical protein